MWYLEELLGDIEDFSDERLGEIYIDLDKVLEERKELLRKLQSRFPGFFEDVEVWKTGDSKELPPPHAVYIPPKIVSRET